MNIFFKTKKKQDPGNGLPPKQEEGKPRTPGGLQAMIPAHLYLSRAEGTRKKLFNILKLIKYLNFLEFVDWLEFSNKMVINLWSMKQKLKQDNS